MTSSSPLNVWTPGRIVDALQRGAYVPADWRERLTRAGYQLPAAPAEPTLWDDPT